MTQAVCEVCAVSYDDVTALAERLPTRPEVISLDPSTLGEVLADVPRLADAAGVPEAGARLVEKAGARLAAVEQAVEGAPRPRVAALEWLDPVYVGGHWVPQMIELAGGEDARPARREVAHRKLEEVEASAPEIVLSMPCGLYAEEAAAGPCAGAATSSCSARAWSPWTRPPTSRGPARAWWTAWSCSAPASPRTRAGAAIAALDRDRPPAGAGSVTNLT